MKIEVTDKYGNTTIYESINEAIKKTGHSHRYIKARLMNNNNRKGDFQWKILK